MGMYILCPYFRAERKKSITCEDTIRSYCTYKEKKEILMQYCSESWKECPYARKMNSIYSLDIPTEQIKEKIMKNKIEAMDREINDLMRRNGKLAKKVEDLKGKIADMNDIASKNHEMYKESLEKKTSLLKAKDEQIKWLESLASAFLVVAYGEDTREVSISKEKILKLMTQYQMSYKPTEDGQAFIFSFGKVKGEKS